MLTVGTEFVPLMENGQVSEGISAGLGVVGVHVLEARSPVVG